VRELVAKRNLGVLALIVSLSMGKDKKRKEKDNSDDDKKAKKAKQKKEDDGNDEKLKNKKEKDKDKKKDKEDKENKEEDPAVKGESTQARQDDELKVDRTRTQTLSSVAANSLSGHAGLHPHPSVSFPAAVVSSDDGNLQKKLAETSHSTPQVLTEETRQPVDIASIATDSASASSASRQPFPRKERKPFPSKTEQASYQGLQTALNALPKDPIELLRPPGPPADEPVASVRAPMVRLGSSELGHSNPPESSSSSSSKQVQGNNSARLGVDQAILFKGFRTMRLNGVYVMNAKAIVNQRPTYWDHRGRIFVYYRLRDKCWALCPRSQDGKDFLKDGCSVSIAHEHASGTFSGTWMEFYQNAWISVNIILQPDKSSELAVPAICPVPALVSQVKPQPRRSIIARRESDRVKVWSDNLHVNAAESQVQKILESQPLAEEIIVFRDGDIVQVAVHFRDEQSEHDAKAITDSLFPGCHAESGSVDECTYGRLFDRVEGHMNSVRTSANRGTPVAHLPRLSLPRKETAV